MTSFYPVYGELNGLINNAAENFSKGNFSLWYNKMIPVVFPDNKDNAFCACDNRGDKDGRTNFYKTVYDSIKRNSIAKNLLEKKHCRQMHYAEHMKEHDFTMYSFTATLDTPLITGIGESHPSETSLIFDHTTGIPFIPSSGIKGMVRFAHSKNLLIDDKGNFNDDFVIDHKDKKQGLIRILDEKNPETRIPLFFGGEYAKENEKPETTRGKIIFMDAYPVNVPELHEDIINPHYSKYYDDNNEPPGDWHDPVPIKFLAVAPQTEFIFRFLLDSEAAKYKDQFVKAVEDALKTEGIGAKTGVGYGRFKSLSQAVPKELKTAYDEYLKNLMTDKEKQEKKIKEFIGKIKNAKNAGEIDSLFSIWRLPKNEFMSDNIDIAKAFKSRVKKKKSSGDFTKQYNTVMKILELQKKDNDSQENIALSDDNKAVQPKPSEPGQHITQDEEKLKKIIDRGYCTKKEKNKLLKKYKKDFPDLCSKIKHLPDKKPNRN